MFRYSSLIFLIVVFMLYSTVLSANTEKCEAVETPDSLDSTSMGERSVGGMSHMYTKCTQQEDIVVSASIRMNKHTLSCENGYDPSNSVFMGFHPC